MPRFHVLFSALVALTASIAAQPAQACRTASIGAGCVAAPVRVAAVIAPEPAPVPPAVEVGQRLDRGRYSILLNAEYYGLPPVSDGWVYMRVERDVFRVDWRSHQVIERVTHLASANF